MKNKNNIKEDMSYTSSSSSSMPTSTSTSTSSSSANKNGTTINLKKKDLSDPTVQSNISKMKGAQVNVLDEEAGDGIPSQLVYLSDVKDAKTGEISKPFTINGKLYQMVRARTPDKKEVMGVYEYDEAGGNEIVHDMKHFEENIAKGAANPEQLPQENPEESPMPVTQDAGHPMEEKAQPKPEVKGEKPSFAGFKFFIVNRKNGKSRKFKNVSELARTSMTEDEEYMGLKDFKKYVDEVLFGGRKGVMKEDTPVDPTIVASAQKLMTLIQQKIPGEVIKNIQSNTVAQREVILAFAKMIGVPSNETNKITLGIKALETTSNNAPSVTSQDATISTTVAPAAPVTEGTGSRKVIKTIKIKELK